MNLFEIVIPPGRETKTLNNIDTLLNDKEQLALEIDKNIHNLKKEQLEYLKSLLNLETSIFENDKLNERLVENPLFFHVSKYNLYEGLLKILKRIDGLSKDDTKIDIGVPERNWLELTSFDDSGVIAIPLLEIEMYPEASEITIYDSNGYNAEIESRLRSEYYERHIKDPNEIELRLKYNKQKREITKIVSNEILTNWGISGFEEGMSYDEKEKVKRLSWVDIYKKDLYD